MSWLHSAFQLQRGIDPLSRGTFKVGGTRVSSEGALGPPVGPNLFSSYLYKSTTPANPIPAPVADPNAALNAGQAQADALRQRRGLLANLFAGAGNQNAVTGKQSLGT